MDVIKRTDAIDALNECEDIKGFGYRQMHDALMEIPRADRPQGEWMFVESKISDRKLKKCSVCGLGYVSLKPDNYCPNCGARMKGVDDNRDYERAAEQREYDMLYESTYNPEDGSM